MLLRTFGAPLASTALRHCITIRWLSVGSATDGILLKTDFAFELPDIPDRESIILGFNRPDRFSQCHYASGGRGLTFFIIISVIICPGEIKTKRTTLTEFDNVSISESVFGPSKK